MSNSPESVPLRVAAKTAEAFLSVLERIAVALEAHLELATKEADPEHISADDVREAKRELLLVYADELGVAAWVDENLQIPATQASNDDLRRWCLAKLAGEELVPF